MTAQDWGGVITQEVPDDVYDDFLEHFLLLSGCRHLCELSTRDGVPSCLGMFSRNDLVHWAVTNLDEPAKQEFLGYADELATAFSGRLHPGLPRPVWEKSQHASPAEELARNLLENGTCPLWSAARQVALLMRRERPRHACIAQNDRGESFTFGAYSKGPFAGFCRLTLTHPNSARLFNALIAHLRPDHRWASIGLMFNCLLPPHTDRGNSKDLSLVTSLSLHEAGEIWIECPGGKQFQEHAGNFVPGRIFRCSYKLSPLRRRDACTAPVPGPLSTECS